MVESVWSPQGSVKAASRPSTRAELSWPWVPWRRVEQNPSGSLFCKDAGVYPECASRSHHRQGSVNETQGSLAQAVGPERAMGAGADGGSECTEPLQPGLPAKRRHPVLRLGGGWMVSVLALPAPTSWGSSCRAASRRPLGTASFVCHLVHFGCLLSTSCVTGSVLHTGDGQKLRPEPCSCGLCVLVLSSLRFSNPCKAGGYCSCYGHQLGRACEVGTTCPAPSPAVAVVLLGGGQPWHSPDTLTH